MFQNLRVNSQLYILHKETNPYIECGAVVSVSAPKPKYPTTAPLGTFPTLEMVVDLVVNINGQDTTFQGLPAGADIADFSKNGNIVISCSRDAMNQEVSTMRQRSEEIINSIEYHRNVISSCDKMFTFLNPEFAAKQQQEKEMADMRRQMEEMGKSLNALMAMNKQLMEQYGGSEAANTKNRKERNGSVEHN